MLMILETLNPVFNPFITKNMAKPQFLLHLSLKAKVKISNLL